MSEGLEVRIFHFDRAGVVGELIKEHLPIDTDHLTATRGVGEVDPFSPIGDEIVEVLEPRGHSRM